MSNKDAFWEEVGRRVDKNNSGGGENFQEQHEGQSKSLHKELEAFFAREEEKARSYPGHLSESEIEEFFRQFDYIFERYAPAKDL